MLKYSSKCVSCKCGRTSKDSPGSSCLKNKWINIEGAYQRSTCFAWQNPAETRNVERVRHTYLLLICFVLNLILKSKPSDFFCFIAHTKNLVLPSTIKFPVNFFSKKSKIISSSLQVCWNFVVLIKQIFNRKNNIFPAALSIGAGSKDLLENNVQRLTKMLK